MSEIKRSTYDDNQRHEEESRLYLKMLFNRYGWKFRDLNQDNDIDAEIEVFEPTAEERNQTTAKFIKAQIKSTINSSVSRETVSYNCPVKFLHFCDVCDIPVILLLYDVNNQVAYWTWVQRYIYLKLDSDNPNWRKNKETVMIKLSIDDYTASNLSFFSKLHEIAFEGIHDIVQMRKTKTYKQYYTVVKESDISTGLARRISARILVENSFSSSKEAMRAIIPLINNVVSRN